MNKNKDRPDDVKYVLATMASLGMFLSRTSARLLRIPAESIAPTERRMPRKKRTPNRGMRAYG